MRWKNSTDHYNSLSIALHWLMLVLIVAAYSTIELRELFSKGSDPRDALKSFHFMLGMSVFFLVWLRLAFRFIGTTPAITPEPNKHQQKAAEFMHIALYALMIITPILGWLLLSSVGKPVPFFGLEIPTLIGESQTLKPIFKELHELMGTTGYFLIGLHAAAGLFHHYVQRDNTMLRMLPHKD
jgi:superoxide oxidase